MLVHIATWSLAVLIYFDDMCVLEQRLPAVAPSGCSFLFFNNYTLLAWKLGPVAVEFDMAGLFDVGEPELAVACHCLQKPIAVFSQVQWLQTLVPGIDRPNLALCALM